LNQVSRDTYRLKTLPTCCPDTEDCFRFDSLAASAPFMYYYCEYRDW
jgi:hypothetical protein